MRRIVYVVALLGALLSALMALSLFSVRTAGYHVSGFAGWVSALLGWGLAVKLASLWERDDDGLDSDS